jgi:hypothetical protein
MIGLGLAVLVCAIGLIVYLLAEKPKTAEAGRLAYMIALAVILWCSCSGAEPLAKFFLRK